MALYELTPRAFKEVEATSLAGEGVRERQDLQRLLIERIGVLDPNLFVIAEEFGSWDESSRRIDILALDRNANLVVIELKRTRDGGHLELQALRYAAMISTMTFEQVCRARDQYAGGGDAEGSSDAESSILEFLGWEEPDEERFGNDVRILLVSEDFSKEVTSTVLWLNDRGLDIRCVRLTPYRLDDRLLLDVQQIIPLPEAQEYQVRVRDKTEQQRRSSREKRSLSEIWSELEQRLGPEGLDAARAIRVWIEQNADLFTTRDGFAPDLVHRGVHHFPFKVRARGEIRIWFQYLANRSPFSDERLRLELLERLNKIPGVEIGRDRIRGKPKIDLLLLGSPEARQDFIETLDWIASTIRAEKTNVLKRQ